MPVTWMRRHVNASRRIGICLLVVGAACASGANYSSTCSRQCDNCEGPFYTTDAEGSCVTRTNKTPSFYIYTFLDGTSVYNIVDNSVGEIRDEASCMNIANTTFDSPLGHFVATFSASKGCRIKKAKGPTLYDLGVIYFPVRFGTRDWKGLLFGNLAAAALGITMGLVSGKYGTERNVDHGGKAWKIFGPGAKMVAKNNCVSSWRLRFVVFYRFTQVVANVWFPMTLFWFFTPKIVAPMWLLFYWIPAFAAHGLEVATKPRHLVTVASCSLLGISEDQDKAVYQYLLSMVRPPLMLASCFGCGWIAVARYRSQGFADNDIGHFIFNKQAYLNMGLNNHWGHVVFGVVLLVNLLSTCLFMALTLSPVLKSLRDIPYNGELITLEEDDDLYQEVDALADEICQAAYADLKKDKDRVNDLEVKTKSKNGAIFALFASFMHVPLYVYKVVTFLRSAKYFLAAVMVFSCAEAFTVLVYRGHLRKVGDAFKQTVQTGIPTVEFLALVAWDHGVAGIPSLMLSVYGLPLVEPSQPQAFFNILVLLWGTRSVAKYLGDLADGQMYEVSETATFAAMAGAGADDSADE